MEYVLTPYSQEIHTFTWWEGAFTDEELDWLQDKAKRAEHNALVGGKNSINKNARRSRVSWIFNKPDTEWIFEKLAVVASKLNIDYFKFNITGFGEPLQLTNYDQSDNGMYGWHQDFGANVSRKLSLVVQLTDPSEYEGGNLQVTNNCDPINVRKQRGLVVAFPSYVIHQVTPVVQGSRQSLVAWVSGPNFK